MLNKEDSGPNVRVYISETGSVYEEAIISPQDTFSGGYKIGGGKRVALLKQRYITHRHAISILKQRGQGKKAIRYAFDISKQELDCYEKGGIVVYTISGKKELQFSRKITQINPPLKAEELSDEKAEEIASSGLEYLIVEEEVDDKKESKKPG